MRDYIYLGDRLLAEYQPQTGQIYYYTSDQVNSTRVVTDQNGVRVFAATYDPYGGIQKIWENSYSPAMKFSGKERDAESNLDYFGARYYGNYYYRWLSPDPVINKDAALTSPQLWNLYSFCHNNPVTYWDPNGLTEAIFYVARGILYVDPQRPGVEPYEVPATSGLGKGMNNPEMEREKNIGPIPRGEYEIHSEDVSNPGRFRDWIRNFKWLRQKFNIRLSGDWGDWRVRIIPLEDTDTFDRKDFFLHGGEEAGSRGCIDIGGGKYGNELTNKVLFDIMMDPDKIIPLSVK